RPSRPIQPAARPDTSHSRQPHRHDNALRPGHRTEQTSATATRLGFSHRQRLLRLYRSMFVEPLLLTSNNVSYLLALSRLNSQNYTRKHKILVPPQTPSIPAGQRFCALGP